MPLVIILFASYWLATVFVDGMYAARGQDSPRWRRRLARAEARAAEAGRAVPADPPRYGSADYFRDVAAGFWEDRRDKLAARRAARTAADVGTSPPAPEKPSRRPTGPAPSASGDGTVPDGPIIACDTCGARLVNQPPARWKPEWGPAPAWSHPGREPFCPSRPDVPWRPTPRAGGPADSQPAGPSTPPHATRSAAAPGRPTESTQPVPDSRDRNPVWPDRAQPEPRPPQNTTPPNQPANQRDDPIAEARRREDEEREASSPAQTAAAYDSHLCNPCPTCGAEMQGRDQGVCPRQKNHQPASTSPINGGNPVDTIIEVRNHETSILALDNARQIAIGMDDSIQSLDLQAKALTEQLRHIAEYFQSRSVDTAVLGAIGALTDAFNSEQVASLQARVDAAKAAIDRARDLLNSLFADAADRVASSLGGRADHLNS